MFCGQLAIMLVVFFMCLCVCLCAHPNMMSNPNIYESSFQLFKMQHDVLAITFLIFYFMHLCCFNICWQADLEEPQTWSLQDIILTKATRAATADILIGAVDSLWIQRLKNHELSYWDIYLVVIKRIFKCIICSITCPTQYSLVAANHRIIIKIPSAVNVHVWPFNLSSVTSSAVRW